MKPAATHLVVGDPAGIAGRIADSLGAGVELLDPSPGRRGDGAWSDENLLQLAASSASTVVLADAVPPVGSHPLSEVGLDRWDALAEAPLRRSWGSLRAVRASRQGVTVFLVTSAVGLAGAAGRVMAASAAEGQRMLVKSAARQWAGDGLVVLCLALHPRALGDERSEPLTDAAPAAGPERDLLVDLVRTVERLSGPEMAHMAGATVVLDGAGTMVP